VRYHSQPDISIAVPPRHVKKILQRSRNMRIKWRVADVEGSQPTDFAKDYRIKGVKD
jgi:hypothetical protein